MHDPYAIECPQCGQDESFILSPKDGGTYICLSCGCEAILGRQLVWKIVNVGVQPKSEETKRAI